MAKIVSEIMNRELFTVRPGDMADEVMGYLLTLGITAAPVVDTQSRPLGVVSLRDLIGQGAREAAFTKMTAPAGTVAHDAEIETAANMFAETGYHHLVVVDDDGHATGFVGAIDVIRGLIGKSAPHPASFPHYDHETGMVWTDQTTLALENVDVAPDAPGLYQLIVGGAGEPDTIVWSEATRNVRTRLIELLSVPTSAAPHLHEPIKAEQVRFKAAAAPSARALTEAIHRMREEHGSTPTPAGA